MKYSAMLQEAWECEKEYQGEYSKLEFLSDIVFNFITYDSDMAELFAGKMLDVISAILHQKTFEFINIGLDNYFTYLTMVNMPFMINKIEWGTSIRGAWFDENDPIVVWEGITIESGELSIFMGAMLEWSDFKTN